MDLGNKTTSEFRTVFDSPLGVPNSQVSLYYHAVTPHGNTCTNMKTYVGRPNVSLDLSPSDLERSISRSPIFQTSISHKGT